MLQGGDEDSDFEEEDDVDNRSVETYELVVEDWDGAADDATATTLMRPLAASVSNPASVQVKYLFSCYACHHSALACRMLNALSCFRIFTVLLFYQLQLAEGEISDLESADGDEFDHKFVANISAEAGAADEVSADAVADRELSADRSTSLEETEIAAVMGDGGFAEACASVMGAGESTDRFAFYKC